MAKEAPATEAEAKENKLHAIAMAVALTDKEFGKGSIMQLGDKEIEPWPSVSTGALTLDKMLGIGGMPKGRVVELYGPESSGKSTLALSVVAQAQKTGLVCVYIDAENALDPRYMQRLGVNLDELWLSQPSSAEEALKIVENMVKTGEVGVVVVDSVAALVPQAELDGEMGDSHMGIKARLMGQAMRKLVNLIAETNTLVLFINQLRMKIGVVYGNPETQPGGKALPYAASLRLDIRKKEDIKDKKTGAVIGLRSKVKAVKNKMGPPLKMSEFDIIYGEGIDDEGCIFDLGVEMELIEKSGTWFTIGGEKNCAQGRDQGVRYLKDNPEIAKALRETILND